MATVLTLTLNVPDPDLPDLIAALKLRYATNGNPNPTQAQLRAALENSVRQDLIAAVVQYRHSQTAITPPVLT
jgi:hypothetical protein